MCVPQSRFTVAILNWHGGYQRTRCIGGEQQIPASRGSCSGIPTGLCPDRQHRVCFPSSKGLCTQREASSPPGSHTATTRTKPPELRPLPQMDPHRNGPEFSPTTTLYSPPALPAHHHRDEHDERERILKTLRWGGVKSSYKWREHSRRQVPRTLPAMVDPRHTSVSGGERGGGSLPGQISRLSSA